MTPATPLAWRGSLSVIASFNNYADDGALEGVSQPSVKVMEPCGDTNSPSVPHARVHDPDSSPHYGILDLGPTDEIPTDENRIFDQLRVISALPICL